jgi:hypothetical protein
MPEPRHLGHYNTKMASSRLNSVQCRNYGPLAVTFHQHFEGFTILFLFSIFIIVGLVQLLLHINDIRKEQFGKRSNETRVLDSPIKIVAKFLGSTSVLGLVAGLFTFQMLFILFVAYCVEGMGWETILILFCIIAGASTFFIFLGIVAWLCSIVVLLGSCISWILNIKRPVTQRGGQAAASHTENATQLDDLQRNHELVIGQERVKSPAPTLPPYTA